MKTGIGLCFLAALMMTSQSAEAEDVLWQVPTYAMLPSASGIGRPVLAQTSDGTSRLFFGASWSGLQPDGYADRAPIALAIDPRDGKSLWKRDLGTECGQGLRGYRTTAQFSVALPNGDVGIAMRGVYELIEPGDWRLASSTCFVRLSAADGRILWVRNDRVISKDEANFSLISLAAAGSDMVAFGRYGDSMRAMRLSGTDGSLRWTNEGRDGTYLYFPNAVAFDAAAAEVILLTAVPRDNEGRTELVGLDAEDGHERWRRVVCERSSLDAKLASIEGGGVAFFAVCIDPYKRTLAFGRASNDSTFRIPMEESSRLYDYDFDEAGNLYVAGELRIDNADVALASLSTLDGRQRWSVRGRLGGQEAGSSDLATPNLIANAGSVHVWEMTGYYTSTLATASRLSRYDAATGRLLAVKDVAGMERDRLQRTSHLVALPGGHVGLAALGGDGENEWLWLARASAGAMQEWMRREKLDAAQPGHAAFPYSYFGSPVAVEATDGTPAWIVAGHATTDEDSLLFGGVPFLNRLAQDDGRVVWEWQRPSPLGLPATRGYLSSLAVNAPDAYVAGRGDAAFVAAIDLSSGTTRWERPLETERLLAGAADTLYAVGHRRVQRLSKRNGNILWQVDLPGPDDFKDDALGGTDDAGNPVFSMLTSHGRRGAQIVKMRAEDGAVLWQWHYPDLGTDSAPSDLKILPGGDVVLTRPFTRLDGDTGRVVWQQSDFLGTQLLQGKDGRLVVGMVWKIDENAEPSGPAQLARLDPATGRTLWSVPYPSTSGTVPMALDGRGDVLVAVGEWNEIQVFRFSGIDGSTLEKKVIAAEYSGGEPPSGLFVAEDGAVFVVADVYDPVPDLRITKMFKLQGAGGQSPGHGRPGERALPQLLRQQPRPPVRGERR